MLNTACLLDHFTTLPLDILTYTRKINTTRQNGMSVITHTYHWGFFKASKFAPPHIKNNFNVQNLQIETYLPRKTKQKGKKKGRKPNSSLATKDLEMQDIWYGSYRSIFFLHHLYGLCVRIFKISPKPLCFVYQEWAKHDNIYQLKAKLRLPYSCQVFSKPSWVKVSKNKFSFFFNEHLVKIFHPFLGDQGYLFYTLSYTSLPELHYTILQSEVSLLTGKCMSLWVLIQDNSKARHML